MPQSPIATAADYADAMITARRAKNWFFGLLLLILLMQLGIFFAARYSPGLLEPTAANSAARAFAWLRYLVGISDFLGVTLSIVMALVLMLLLTIMLVGRLIGVARVTSALVWCLILIVLLFPWQAFLSNASRRPPASAITETTASTAATLSASTTLPTAVTLGSATLTPATSPTEPAASTPAPPVADFKVPGVLYTWSELTHPDVGARFGMNKARTEDPFALILRWARFVGFPVIALLILLAVQSKSSRGLRMALGEADYEALAVRE